MAELRTILASLALTDATAASDAAGGGVAIIGGEGDGSGTGGTLGLTAGAGGATGNGGAVELTGGSATDGDGGTITLTPGTSSGSGDDGLVKILNLPIADPVVANALWNDGGTLKISAG